MYLLSLSMFLRNRYRSDCNCIYCIRILHSVGYSTYGPQSVNYTQSGTSLVFGLCLLYIVVKVRKCRDEYAIHWEGKMHIYCSIVITIFYIVFGFLFKVGTPSRIVAINWLNVSFVSTFAAISTYLVIWKYKKQKVWFCFVFIDSIFLDLKLNHINRRYSLL